MESGKFFNEKLEMRSEKLGVVPNSPLSTLHSPLKKSANETFIAFIRSLGLDVNTHTKARGHQGIFLKNRIDVSHRLNNDRKIEVLAHEFAHYIHLKIEPDMQKTHGTLEKLFQTENAAAIERELYSLTLAIDKNASLELLKKQKEDIKRQMKVQKEIILKFFPRFSISDRFKDFHRYIKSSKAKHFLKYDRIRFVTPFLRREEIYCIDNIEQDFKEIPEPYIAYIRLMSLKRKRARASRRINKYNKYYKQPTELFARFIESFFVDKNIPYQYAPESCRRFFELLRSGHYYEMKDLFILMEN